MPQALEVTSQSPPPLVSEPVSSEKVEVVLLHDDLIVDVYNLSFDELQKRIVQVRRKHFLNDQASPAFLKERVIVSNIKKHMASLADATLAYGREMSSKVKFLLA